MTELEKANQTIKELLEINEQLSGLNGENGRARRKILDLEKRLRQAEEKNRKYQRILENRKTVIKIAMKEAIKEMIFCDEEAEE